MGDLLADADMRAVLHQMCSELVAVAGADGVAIDAGLPDVFLAILATTDQQGRSSLHLDLTQGRRGELDVLLADPLERGRQHGVDTPVLRAVLAATRVRHGLLARP